MTSTTQDKVMKSKADFPNNYQETYSAEAKTLGLIVTLDYCVHRQYVGRFTPIYSKWNIVIDLDQVPENQRQQVVVTSRNLFKPYTQQALMVDVDSPFFVMLLKGQEANINRKDQYDRVYSIVKTQGLVWYSHNEVPPITAQEQHVVSYDVGDPRHGSMLSPHNCIEGILARLNALHQGLLKIEFEYISGQNVARN